MATSQIMLKEDPKMNPNTLLDDRLTIQIHSNSSISGSICGLKVIGNGLEI
jgi:hypothetical protein